MNNEYYVNHEVRMQMVENAIISIKDELKELRKDMGSQFKWIIGTLVGLFCGTFVPLFGGIILHMAKLM